MWTAAAFGLLWIAADGPRVALLEGFESEADLGRWELTAATARLTTADVTEGRSAVEVLFQPIPEGQQGWPAIKWTSREGRPFGLTDWSAYSALVFDACCLDDAPFELRLRLDDAAGGRWTTGRELPPGEWFAYRVPITDFAALDRTQMRHIDIFLSSPRRPHRVRIDNLRLVAEPLALVEEVARDDPFGKGRARLRGRLSRAVPWRVRVLDGAGREVWSTAGVGAEIRADVTGRDTAGRPFPAGRYPVRLELTDPVEDGQVTTRTWLAMDVTAGGPPLLFWPAGSGEKIFLDDYPRRALAAPLRLDMVKNEVEAQQVVLQAGADLQQVHVAVENLRHEAGGPSPTVTVYQVGYVDCAPPPYPVRRNGWWPDPLLPVDTFDISDHEAQPVWLSWRSNADTAPGVHSAELVVSAEGVPPTRVPLEIIVHDLTLPVETHTRTAFSTYDHMIRQVHGELPRELMMKYWEFIADHRINPDNIYRSTPPDIEVLEHFHAQGRLNAFTILSVGGAPEPWSEQHKAELSAKLDPFIAALRERPELLRLGHFYGYDEAPESHWPALRANFGWLKERYPDIPIMTTAYDHSFGTRTGLNDVVDIWVPLTPRYDLALARQVRAAGKQVWWYTCIGPQHPYPNWFIEYEAIEARLIFWQLYQNEVEGHLYYTMSRWPLSKHPIDPRAGARTDWPPASYQTANGDGSLFCAGPDGPLTTIRFENVRDGLEDAELFRILDERRRGREDEAPAARDYVARLTPNLREYSRDSAALAAVRREAIEAAVRLGR